MKPTNPFYNYACVYQISNADGSKHYIGSTTKPVAFRVDKHIKDYTYFLKSKQMYYTSFEIVKDPGFTYKIVEEFNSGIFKNDLFEIEGKYQRTINCVNKKKEKRTLDDLKKYATKYYNDNKAIICAKHNVPHFCKDCGGKYTHANKTIHLKSKKHNKAIATIVNNVAVVSVS